MARALIEGGRESDARRYANEILAANPNDKDGINLLAESHTHIAQRKLDQAPKPLTDVSLNDIYASVDQELQALAQLPQNPRNQVAQAQLHRLYYVLMNDQIQKAKAAEQEAGLSLDAVGQEKARQRLATMKDPTPHRERCVELLRAALKQDPKYIHAAEY